MILVCGEALIDLTPDGIGVEADTRYRPLPGGGPFNTAVALGRLGAPAGFLGRLSYDGFGSMLGRRLTDAGVDTRFVAHGDEPTPLAVITKGATPSQHTFSFYVEGTADRLLTVADLPANADGIVAVHVGTVALVQEPIGSALEVFVERMARRVVVGLDPNVRPALVRDRAAYVARLHRLAALADVVKVSDDDASWIEPGPPEVLAQRWVAAGAAVVVITRGASGPTAHTAGHPPVSVPAAPADVVDTVGAGDAFNAGLLCWLHEHDRLTRGAVRSLNPAEIASMLTFAAEVAAITCSRAGADPPWRHELGGQPNDDAPRGAP